METGDGRLSKCHTSECRRILSTCYCTARVFAFTLVTFIKLLQAIIRETCICIELTATLWHFINPYRLYGSLKYRKGGHISKHRIQYWLKPLKIHEQRVTGKELQHCIFHTRRKSCSNDVTRFDIIHWRWTVPCQWNLLIRYSGTYQNIRCVVRKLLSEALFSREIIYLFKTDSCKL